VAHRVALVAADEGGHVAVERRREEHGLALRGGPVEDAPDLGEEPHVGHPVGLVDDHTVDVVEPHGALLHQVGQATGAGHEDVHPAAQGTALGVVAHPAVHGEGVQAPGRGDGVQFGADLLGELAGGGEHQGAGAPRRPPLHRGDEGDPEGEGLARAGGSAAADVAAGEGVGDGGGLDGKGSVTPPAARAATISAGAPSSAKVMGIVRFLLAPRCGD